VSIKLTVLGKRLVSVGLKHLYPING